MSPAEQRDHVVLDWTDDESGGLLRRSYDDGYDEGWRTDLPGEEETISGRLPQEKPGRIPRKGWAERLRVAVFGVDKTQSEKRRIPLHARQERKYPRNTVRNQKYSVVTFLPLVLYEQFKFFFNLYFLLVALSQFVPALRIGFLATYICPLSFVLSVTIGKEAYDDYQRFLRDRLANSAKYMVLDESHVGDVSSSAQEYDLESAEPNESLGLLSDAPVKWVSSADIHVGSLVLLEKNMRVPADMLLLRTSDSSGTCFVRTDQLDGETDWKLRVAVEQTQNLGSDAKLLYRSGAVIADPPSKDIHNFNGTIQTWPRGEAYDHSRQPGWDPLDNELDAALSQQQDGDVSAPSSFQASPTEALVAENMLWANTVLAAGSAVGVVVYTGTQTRAVMNTSQPGTKVGLLDLEINRLAKILCVCTFCLSVMEVALNGFRGQWYIYIFRFLILFSSIIPISLRVNLDMGKTYYARQIMRDPEIPGTIVRTSTLPEELGRIEYLLSDKTGTLTQNEMELKKLHLGTISYTLDTMDEVARQLAVSYSHGNITDETQIVRGRRDISSRIHDIVQALVVCHNVTPTTEDDTSQQVTYQASSPDEVAIVKWTESVGLRLVERDRTKMTIQTQAGEQFSFDILEIFPFTSESKRMGIVVRDRSTGEILFYQKGADVVMTKLVAFNDWLDEECGNMAREGLRTLVIARKKITEQTWARFEAEHKEARVQAAANPGSSSVQGVIAKYLERDLELLGVTGVEDKLQDDVKSTIELLRNAGIKIWMLTGDKIETATCIAVSTKLVARNQFIHQVAKLRTAREAREHLDFIANKLDCCLVIDGESLQLCIELFRDRFIELATKLSAVVACRCSPTQKADVARLIRAYTKKRVCCIGDGGNDVSMIQAADVGVGIVGKEGRQASLAADFSVEQFAYLTQLLLWHGRNSYKRSAKLAQFVIHRGLIISIIQAVFSSVFYFSPIAIYQGWLMVGYATIYTMAPVFSLVLDRDVSEDLALLYPELYKELTKGRVLTLKTFLIWFIISIYQGGTIMMISLVLFEKDFVNIVAISFTALVLNELIMVAVEFTTWHPIMIISEVATLSIYAGSMFLLPEYFDVNFVLTTRFAFKVGIIVLVSASPLWIIKILKSRFAPTQYAKLLDY